jgi:probable HAF family extracellular repeat protein
MTVLASTGVAGAYNCSTDGSVVVGYNGTNFSDYQACYWREGVRTSIGALPGDTTSYATGCSNDGSVIVGVSTGATNHGFRWTAGTGMVDIGVAPGARSNVQVRVCSGDGSALVGIAAQTNYTDNVAFRWSLLDGYTILGGPDADGVTISKNGTIMGGDNYIQGQIWRLV